MKNYIRFVEEEKREIERIIKQITRELSNSPEGKINISHSHGNVQYYFVNESSGSKSSGSKSSDNELSVNKVGNYKQNDNKSGRYIRKKNIDLIRKLAQKTYDQDVLKELIKKQKNIVTFLNSYRTNDDICNEVSEERKKLIIPWVYDEVEFRRKWEEEEYMGKGFDDNVPEIYTEKGERVRSKSEKILADKFYAMDIPYRYEYPIVLNGIKIYPDFHVLNVRERKEYIFEHFGMMDIPEYSENVVKKINTYARNGIVIGEKLLFTCETNENPIDMRSVDKLIKQYLL